jgi:thiol-disulfide isomerase/thioredoxin
VEEANVRISLSVCVLVLLATLAPAQEARPSPADRVEEAMLACLADGPHWNRCGPLVAIGSDAVAPLLAILADTVRSEGQRVLAAQALGRLGAAAAKKPLRALAASEETSVALAETAEESLFLLGDTSPVDARVERLLTKYAGIAIARDSAFYRIARTYCNTGRFASAARIMRGLVDDTEDEDRRRYLAYDWACYECLAGNREAALEVAGLAVEFTGVDLDWMARDGDLGLIREDPEFLALVAAARARTAAGSETEAPAEPTAEEAEYRAFSRSYWDGAFDEYIAASNSYWEGFQDWLEAEGREHGDEAVAAWRELRKGPPPEDPAPAWIPRFRERLAKHEGTPLAARIRGELLTIYGNQDMAGEWVALFLETVAKTPTEEGIGHEAGSALYWSEKAERREEVLGALRAVVKAHPDAKSGAGIRIALAEERRQSGDDAAAREHYAEVLRIYPDSFSAKEAKGALYEMDHLVVGKPAPEFAATDIHGRPVSLASLRGKVVVLDFWATWCGPCLGELPYVKKLHGAFGARDDFALIGISLDPDGLALVDFLEEEGMGWPQVCTLAEFDEPLARLFNVRGIPDTFLLDREGRIIERGLRGDRLLGAVSKALDGR